MFVVLDSVRLKAPLDSVGFCVVLDSVRLKVMLDSVWSATGDAEVWE